jgi:hypothetical protein
MSTQFGKFNCKQKRYKCAKLRKDSELFTLKTKYLRRIDKRTKAAPLKEAAYVINPIINLNLL